MTEEESNNLTDRELPDEADMDNPDEPGLEQCPYCKKYISEEAERCHHCGSYILREDQNATRRLWIIVGVVLAAILSLLGLFWRM